MGGRYELYLYVNGVQVAGATKLARMKAGSTDLMLPQGDIIAGMARNLDARNADGSEKTHQVEVKAVMVDGGTAEFAVAYLTAQGVPAAANPSAQQTLAATPKTLGSSFIQVSPTVSVRTTAEKDVMLQASSQIAGGTPNDAIEYQFRYKRSTTSTWTNLEATQHGIPCATSTCGTFSHPADSTNVFATKLNLLANSSVTTTEQWQFALFARNASGGSSTIDYNHIDVFTMPTTGSEGSFAETTPVVVSNSGTTLQPDLAIDYIDSTCGNWTYLGQLTVPHTDTTSNWIGQGYIEFLGRGEDDSFTNEGSWDESQVEIVLEPVEESAFDVGHYTISIPRGRYGFHFFTDAMTVGNIGGKTIRMWVRKVRTTNSSDPCLSNACGFYNMPLRGESKFRVGKRAFTMKLLPAGTHYYAAAADCRDGVDNDDDGLVDHPGDSGCSSPDDGTEN